MTRRELVVPIRDRRQRRRILTLKNFGRMMVVSVALVAGILIEEHVRAGQPSTQTYGRLYQQQVQPAAAVPKAPSLAVEPIVDDQTAADPMLVSAGAREQLLRADSNVPPPLVYPAPIAADAAATPTPVVTRGSDGRIAIVGGTEGVTIARGDATKPMLKGGFGR